MITLHIILALLILLAFVCVYSWAYRIKTTKPEIVVTVPAPLKNNQTIKR